MAKGRHTGAPKFEKGNPGGPGRPKLPPELRQAKKLNAIEFEQAIANLTAMTREEVEQLIKHDKPRAATMMERMIVGQMSAATKGKTTPLAFLMDRTLGPVVKKVEVTGKDAGPIEVKHDLSKLNLTEDTFDALVKLDAAIPKPPADNK